MNLVPTVAVIVSAVTALLSMTPSAHALVAPPSASPQHRPPRRATLPSPTKPAPRADRTALRYLDERTDSEAVFRNIGRPSSPATDRRPSSSATARKWFSAATARDERTNAEPVFRNLWTLREQARTIKQHDRQLYFDFINNAASTAPDSAFPPRSFQPLARELSSASAMPRGTTSEVPSVTPSSVPSAGTSPSSLLFSLPSSVASLWTQARTVAEDDRRLYFDFVKNQSLDDNLAIESGLTTVAKRENSVKVDKWW